MKVKIYPSKVKGSVMVPSSKSLTHRAIIAASLANGRSVISNVSYSDDIRATIKVMRQLGAIIEEETNTLVIDGISHFHTSNRNFDVNASGSTLRFCIPLVSLLNKEIIISGTKKLFTRPLDVYKDIYTAQNLLFQLEENTLTLKHSLKAGDYKIRGDVSSQFISGLLFTLPLLEKDSVLEIIPPLESRSYIEMTLAMLSLARIDIIKRSEYEYVIKGNQSYQPFTYRVEGDYSQAAFFAVLGAINDTITITGLNHNSLQGDCEIISILKKSGAKVEKMENGYQIGVGDNQPIAIDLSDIPDLGPILSILAANIYGENKLKNASRLRLKESDRISDLEIELKKFGIHISSTLDEITVVGKIYQGSNEIVNPHDDHRIFMSIAVLATILDVPTYIENAECINKSYPNFLHDLKSLGVKIEYMIE